MTTNDLLRRYVADRSEAAFAELVQQHIALVYSAALRQVNGDVPAAQDVTQAVFTDLARKAPGLTRHTSLTGWLYTSTRYLAAKARRAEQSRRSREQEAHDMNQLLHSTDPDTIWQELRPMLDEAMHDLSATDREAVLLSYFERLPLVEIGARLGLTDKAAHMRVERAIDRLRAALAKRGVTSTITALAAVLTARAAGVVPAGLAAQVSGAALATVAAGGALGWGLLKLVGLLKAPVVIGVGAAAAVAGLMMAPQLWEKNRATTASPIQAQIAPVAVPAKVVAQAPVVAATAPSNAMVLHVVADDTGEPIPGAVIYTQARQTAQEVMQNGRKPSIKLAVTDETGTCQIPLTQDRPGLGFFSHTTNGFVDETASWGGGPRQGQRVPAEYTMRLERAVSVGGVVVDQDGQPVPDAAIAFDMVTRSKERDDNPESPLISYLVGLDVDFGGPSAMTDATGHWHSEKIGKEDLERIRFRASNPDYIGPPRMGGGMANSPLLQQQYLAGTYTNQLTRGLSMSGVIVDVAGRPVAGALMRDRDQPNGKNVTNQADGSFRITALRTGTNNIYVEARGFAVTNFEVDLAADTAPLRLVLQPGLVLRLRLLDTNGAPFRTPLVGGRFAMPEVLLHSSHGNIKLGPLVADEEGRIVWESAPEQDLQLDIRAQAKRLASNLAVRADGEEHVITVRPAAAPAEAEVKVKISGDVSDAATRLPVSRFRIAIGNVYDVVNGVTNVHWNSGTYFNNGKFQLSDQITMRSRPTCFKFEADGYAPFVTRFVDTNEWGVTFNIALQPAAPITVSVLSPDGEPATNTSVGLGIPGNFLTLSPGALWDRQNGGQRQIILRQTDDQGRVDLAQDPSVLRVIAANAEGYGEASAAELSAQPTLRMQPWGRIEGDYLVSGKPAGGRTFRLLFANAASANTLDLDQADYSTTTDANGHFSFPKVPPGKFNLFSSNMDVRSGQTTTVAFHASPVSVRLRWPEGVARQDNYGVSVYYDASGFKETADGTWATELPAGKHKVEAHVSSPGNFTTFDGTATFTVPDETTSGTIDLGEIQLVQTK